MKPFYEGDGIRVVHIERDTLPLIGWIILTVLGVAMILANVGPNTHQPAATSTYSITPAAVTTAGYQPGEGTPTR